MLSMRRLAAGVVLCIMGLVTPGVALAAVPLDGLTVPQPDPALVFVAPTPDEPNYETRLQAFVEITVPDTWNGMPVQFLSTLNDSGADLLGAPTSTPKADPNNPSFVYQRFQNGLLFYNATDGTTSLLPLE
jgi:hypothetical protein